MTSNRGTSCRILVASALEKRDASRILFRVSISALNARFFPFDRTLPRTPRGNRSRANAFSKKKKKKKMRKNVLHDNAPGEMENINAAIVPPTKGGFFA